MPTCTIEKEVRATPEAVFAFLADWSNWEKAVSAIKKIELLTPPPIGKGTRFKETRLMWGKEATETMEITGWDPPRSQTLESDSCGTRVICTISVRPAPTHAPTHTGSILTMHIRSEAQSFFAKLFTPLGYLMMGMMKKIMTKELDEIAAAIEAAE